MVNIKRVHKGYLVRELGAMPHDKPTLFWAYRYYAHRVATLHWAGCPYCKHGKGVHWDKAGNGWIELPYLSEDEAVALVRRDKGYRLCRYCCRDLRDEARKRA